MIRSPKSESGFLELLKLNDLLLLLYCLTNDDYLKKPTTLLLKLKTKKARPSSTKRRAFLSKKGFLLNLQLQVLDSFIGMYSYDIHSSFKC